MSESVPTVPVSPQYRRGCASRMAIPLTSSPTKLMAVIQCVTRTTAEWCISVARRNSSIPFPDLLTWSTVGRSLSLVGASNQLMLWQRWVRQPQNIWFRRALFQVHLWSGIAIGLYILMISVTGSVLVYRNELYRAATPRPIISTSTGPRLTDDQLTAAVSRLYPGYQVENLGRALNLDQAVDVWLRRDDKIKKRLFDPRSGSDLGESVPTSVWLVSSLLDLHDNLLAGPTGRAVNGGGALVVLELAATG